MTAKDILISMRPQQWLKNLIIFAALIFAREYYNSEKVLLSLLTFIIFCLLSGAVYIFNDIVDFEEDRFHFNKQKRPIAAGRLSAAAAGWTASALMLISLIAAFFIRWELGLVALSYAVLMGAYSALLKKIVIVDVLVIAFGFILRVIAGGIAIDVPISAWLYICTFLLALFLALSKRRHELIILEDDAVRHRKCLVEYSPSLLDQMIAVVTSSTVMAYALYALSERTMTEVSDKLYFSIPFVIYGIFRYLYLVHHKAEGGEPSKVLLNDPPLLVDVLLWGISIFILLQLK